ncbi:MAG: VCBS repeat-containing protein [Planctomycetota bacterium]
MPASRTQTLALSLFLTSAPALAQFGTGQTVHVSPNAGLVATVTAVDLDGDGDLDLASTFENAEGVQWFENDGAGVFGPSQPIDPTLPESRICRFGDIDGDGDLDAVAGSIPSSGPPQSVVLYENLGNRVFGPRQVLDSEFDSVTQIRLVDLDDDGDLDVAVGYFCVDLILRIDNLGGGQFAPAVPLVPPGFATFVNEIEFTDIDGDGDMDLVAAVDTFTSSFHVSENLGAGVFAPPVEYLISNSGALDVTPADVDGDGDLDLFVVLDGSSGTYQWQENIGGDFSTTHFIGTTSGSWLIEGVDVDRDGDPDAVCVDISRDELLWYENDGGSFGSERVIDTLSGEVWSVVPADFDGDGRTDLATATGSATGSASGRLLWYANEFPRFEAYCDAAVPHSGGSIGRLFASGSDALVANDVVLEASSLPPFSLSVFLVSRTRGVFPGARGSAGTFCIGGPAGRFLTPGQVSAADAAGNVSLSVDATSLPTSTGTATAQAGETWHFQCWFRDAGVSSGASNLTNGLSVTFE